MHPLLEIKNLSISFQKGKEPVIAPAVYNISFQIERGSFTAVVGESGSGKSLTSLATLQLLPKGAVTDGEIILHLDNHSPDLLKLSLKDIITLRGNRISMIFQEPMTALNPLMTCGKQVSEMFETHQDLPATEARKKTIRLFEEVELPTPEKIFNSYPHQISGGQKQRVMIAMAIACKPDLLIADEPTTALDVRVQKSIMALLKKLQTEHGLSVMLITHDLGLVQEFADDIVVMRKGVLVEKGKAAEVLENPVDAYTKGLLACRPRPEYKGKRLPVLSDFLASSFDPAMIISSETKTEPSQPSALTVPAIEVSHLRVKYPTKKNWLGKTTAYHHAVDDVSFQLWPGETLGIVGESGCGKTTLGKTLLGLIRPDAGQILVHGKNITSGKNELQERKEMQIVFQDPYGSLNPLLTINDAIEEPMKVHHLHGNSSNRKNKTAELLERVGLDPNMGRKYPHQFSGGQRQRICIARALALNPSIMVFDESVSALDVSIQAQVLNLINDLKRDLGFTSLFISHDLSVVRYISDRVLVMKDGKIVEQGDAEELFRHPKEAYTRELLSSVPRYGL